MPAIRLFDCYNGKIGTTQVVGVDSFDISYGFRDIAANNDGFVGEAVHDQGRFFAEGTLRCQDPTNFGTLLALWEANDTRDIYAEGKKAGDTAAAYSATLARAKLAGASFNLQDNQYASTSFSLVNSCAAASDSLEDEVTLAAIASKTVTHATGKRGYRITSGVFGSLTPLSVKGLALNIQGQVDRTAGDADFGETVEVSGYSISGSLTFQDVTVSTGLTMAQRLIAAAMGSLVINFKEANSGTAWALTLSNVRFLRDQLALAGRKFHLNTLNFVAQFLNGTTAYTLATGTNKVIGVAQP